jgi:PAS domain S-box-containing protein
MASHDRYHAKDTMDWRSVAGLLAERGDQPLTFLDPAGRIVLFNGAMERVLGWRRDEVGGRSWIDACVPQDCARAARQWFQRALSGALAGSECEVVTRDGRRLLFEMEMMLVGRGRQQGLLLTVQAAREAEPVVASRELDYEVKSTAGAFGSFRRLTAVGRVVAQDVPNRRCFEALYDRQLPCEDCPILRSGQDAWPRTTVRRREHDDTFEIVTADLAGADTVHVSVRIVPDRALSAIYQARIDAIAKKGRLSERECAVLRHLLLGRSLDDIAAALELSRRTVKFHQSNLLQKLGVDSRVDLIRIIGF